MGLMEDYKKEPGGKEKLKEQNPKWINDDNVKFIRFGSHLIEKNGEGISAFINPHGFLDNPTFCGMPWHLMKTFDKIYSIDLHGNAKKKETAPDGSVDQNVFDIMQGGGQLIFPLYLYPETNPSTGSGQAIQQSIEHSEGRTPNLNPKIVNQIAEKSGLIFTPKQVNGNLCFANNNAELQDEYKQEFVPIDILDYIYAVLHSPNYREKYKEFLKIDFPRVPYPKDTATFWQLVKLGGELRQIHLLESPKVEQYITQYPIDGDNMVGNPKYVPIPKNEETGFLQGNVFINDSQYFANVPLSAWKFYIGGYQPAQKWLKDRKGRTLEFNDILHYKKIIVALSETDRLMKAIDKIEI